MQDEYRKYENSTRSQERARSPRPRRIIDLTASSDSSSSENPPVSTFTPPTSFLPNIASLFDIEAGGSESDTGYDSDDDSTGSLADFVVPDHVSEPASSEIIDRM